MARSRTFRIRLYCTACTLERVQILSMLMLPPSGTRSVHPGGFHETPPSLRFAHQVIRVDNLPQGPQFVSQANAVCIENLIRFDCVVESHNVSANGRADILLAEHGCLALQ